MTERKSSREFKFQAVKLVTARSVTSGATRSANNLWALRGSAQMPRGAQRMIAAPARQNTAPMRSHWSGRWPSTAQSQRSDETM